MSKSSTMFPLIIDNFLEEEYFNELVDLLISGNFPWYYQRFAVDNIDESKRFFFTHALYEDDVARSTQYALMIPFVKKIKERGGFRALLRMRANFFPNTSTLHEYPMHMDFPFPHATALLSLNTCDGYTKIADDTKIDSVANRVVFFNAGEHHCATSTTNERGRFNLIINYL